MSASSTPATTRTSSRLVKQNPLFSPQPGLAKTNGVRHQRPSSASPSPSTREAVQPAWGKQLEGKVKQLEEKVVSVEEENKRLKEEVMQLRGRLEEEEAARRQVEEKLRVVVEVDEKERKKIETDFEREKEEQKQSEERKLKEVKDELKREMKKELKEVEERLATTTTTPKTIVGGSEEDVGDGEDDDDGTDQIYKCVVITDSNGKELTQESIRNHMPIKKRAKYEISVAVAFRLEDAYDRVENGQINVENAYVVIDNITNNLQGGKKHEPDSPELVATRVAALREYVLSKSAKAVIVCELKPMKWVDVRPASRMIHDYLVSCGKGGYGCRTQIRMEYLKDDGFHVQPRHISIIDKTYACALLGVHVPDPTPLQNLVPEFIRRRWEKQFPRMGGRGNPKT